MAMVHLTIDGVPVSVEEGTTVLKAAHAAGIKIPTLCWLKDINEIGAAAVCVVDVGARVAGGGLRDASIRRHGRPRRTPRSARTRAEVNWS